jgi:hypothetical protein
MQNIYLIIDIVDQIELSDMVWFIGQITEYLGISKNLLYYNHTSKKDQFYDTQKQTEIMIKTQKQADKNIIIVENPSNRKSIVNADQQKQYFEEQQTLFKQVLKIVPEINAVIANQDPLRKILEEIDPNVFLLFMHNTFMLQNRFVYGGPWLNNLIQSAPIDEYRICVSKIQRYQSENDYYINPNSIADTGLFEITVDFKYNKIEMRILPLFGITESEAMEFLSLLVTKLLQSYPNSSAYMDTNTYNSMIITPHEAFYNINDFHNDENIDRKGLKIRGYTKYCWLNMKQYQALGGEIQNNELNHISVRTQAQNVYIKLDGQRQTDYAILKHYLFPLLSHGENRVVDSVIFSHPVMLHAIIDDNEWDVIDQSSSYDELVKGESLYNRMQIAKSYRLFKTWQKQGLVGDLSEKGRCVIRSNLHS